MPDKHKDLFRVSAVIPEKADHYFLERDSAAFRSLLSTTLQLGTLQFRELFTQGDATFVRLVNRPRFEKWVPSGLRSSLGEGRIEFVDVSFLHMGDRQ